MSAPHLHDVKTITAVTTDATDRLPNAVATAESAGETAMTDEATSLVTDGLAAVTGMTVSATAQSATEEKKESIAAEVLKRTEAEMTSRRGFAKENLFPFTNSSIHFSKGTILLP